MHRELRHLRFGERHRIAPEAVGDLDPVIAVLPAGLLDDGERAGALERTLDDQRRRLARRIGVFIGADFGGLRRGARPAHRRLAADEEIDADLLPASDPVEGLGLHQIDPGLARLEAELLRLRRAGDFALDQRLVDDLGDIFRRALAEVARLQ